MKPQYEPIRKPKRSQPRGVSLLPLLTGRLLRAVDDGGVYAVNKFGNMHQFHRALRRWSRNGRPLQFAQSDLAILPGSLVAVRAGDTKLAQSALSRVRDNDLPRYTTLSRDDCESRLQRLASYAGNPQASRSVDEARRFTLLVFSDSCTNDPWQTLVRWIGGSRAFRRWQDGMHELSDLLEHPAWWGHARRSAGLLKSLDDQLNVLPAQVRAGRIKSIYKHVIQLAQSPYRVDIDTTFPNVEGTRRCQRKWIRRIRRSIEGRLSKIDSWANHDIPATLAAWMAVDMEHSLDSEQLLRWLRAYDEKPIQAFFATADGLPAPKIQQLLALGTALDSIDSSRWRSLVACKGGKTPGSILSGRLNRITGSSCYRLYESQACFRVYKQWCTWAESWPTSVWTKSRKKAWLQMLIDLCELVTIQPTVQRRWAGWLKSMQKSIHQQNCCIDPIARTDRETRHLAHSLVIYRKASGERSTWPRQIESRIALRDRWQRETEYLRSCEQQNRLSPNAKLRLEHLTNQPAPRLPRTKVLRDRLVQSAMASSMSAARQWIGARHIESLTHLKIPADVYQTAERAGELVRLLANLPTASRRMLIDALRDSAGLVSGFRGLGTANRQWISDAEANGFNFDAWIDPNPQPLKLSKATDALPKNLTVSLTSLPQHVLWMGRPFDSCLDLRGGDYCASVVPNFMDANKQLLVILDGDGRMVGRKLLSITPTGGLLGYYLYLATSRSDSQVYEEVCERVTQYCRQLAERAGLTLSDDGEPQRIHGKAWYDDGSADWKQVKTESRQ